MQICLTRYGLLALVLIWMCGCESSATGACASERVCTDGLREDECGLDSEFMPDTTCEQAGFRELCGEVPCREPPTCEDAGVAASAEDEDAGSDEPAETTDSGAPACPGLPLAEPPSSTLCVDRTSLAVVPPAGLQVRFRLLYCDGSPVQALEDEDVVVWNDNTGIVFGEGSDDSSAAVFGPGNDSAGLEIYTVLLLDLSDRSSTRRTPWSA